MEQEHAVGLGSIFSVSPGKLLSYLHRSTLGVARTLLLSNYAEPKGRAVVMALGPEKPRSFPQQTVTQQSPLGQLDK